MSTILTVSHLSGAGNAFVVVDTSIELSESIVHALCSRRRLGLPDAEGVITTRNQRPTSFDATFYNPDGTIGMMCGNGGRAAVYHAMQRGTKIDRPLTFTMAGTAYLATVAIDDGGTSISVTFPAPTAECSYPKGSLGGVELPVWYVNVNSDHAVVKMPCSGLSDDITQAIRWHSEFPRGVNVNAVEHLQDNTFAIATFERGVERVTGACGTGAISSAIALWRLHQAGTTTRFIPPSTRALTVTINHTQGVIDNVILTGDAREDHPPSTFSLQTLSYVS